MIEIEYKEKEKVDNLYNEIKNIILSKKDNKSFNYNYKQHHLLEELEYPGISKNYFNERGSVEFENINGKVIRLEISRWHPHKHNGNSGLNGIPCLTATICIIDSQETQVVWELKVESGTLYYKAATSSIEIPNNILEEKRKLSNFIIQEYEIVKQQEESQKQTIKSIETRILFEEITNLYNKYKSSEQVKKVLLLKRKKEIEEATEKIIKSYSRRIAQSDENITSTKKELNEFDKLFTEYATFNIDLVGNALQQLISLVESEDYCYKNVTHKFKRRVHGVMDSWDEDIKTKVKIVVKKDKLVDCYDNFYERESTLNELVENGDALLLSEQDVNDHNDKITFYTSQKGQVLCHVNFGRFDYIKESIDSLIQYRFQNNKVEFTEKDMDSFMKDFINTHKNIIIENYTVKIKEKVLNSTPSIS